MRPLLAVIVGITIIYACMHFFVLPEAPDVTRIENITYLESPAYNPAILDLWKIAVRETGVENESAVLRQLEVDLAKDGAIQVIWFYFYGVESGKQHVYEVYVDRVEPSPPNRRSSIILCRGSTLSPSSKRSTLSLLRTSPSGSRV